LKAFNEQIFQVTNRKVVNGKTWYYGKLSNGKYEFIINTTNGYYYDDPSSAKATSLKAFNEQIFQVTNRKVVNGKTWYYGKLSNGKY
ncbi:hypothetical protein EF901_17485, partial [Staphylococcus aureus]